MRDGNRVLCVIPARGGSKGVPGKNVRMLCGIPLIAHSIQHALLSESVDRVVVSTDDDDIARAALEAGADVPFRRPAELATDCASSLSALQHAVGALEAEGDIYGIVVLLHATAPLRTPQDIDCCIDRLLETGADNVISVCPAHRNPYFNMVERKRDGHVGLVVEGGFDTRQEAPSVWDVNASIYVWSGEALVERPAVLSSKTEIYEMPHERSIDIDDEFDFVVAEALMGRGEAGS